VLLPSRHYKENGMLRRQRIVGTLLIGSLSLAPIAGCENLPGGPKSQGAVIGGAGGAAVGAAVAKNNRLLGALIGGALGAGGGYLIGANKDKITGKKSDEARKANDKAQSSPARAADVRNARTADLNDDGFVTLDEVIAMHKANLSDDEMVRRLEDTGQIFELTTEQENKLADAGVSRYVIRQMRTINQDERDRLLSSADRDTSDVISTSRDRDTSRSPDRDTTRDRDRDRGSDRDSDLDF
jgi:hypothetical protein